MSQKKQNSLTEEQRLAIHEKQVHRQQLKVAVQQARLVDKQTKQNALNKIRSASKFFKITHFRRCEMGFGDIAFLPIKVAHQIQRHRRPTAPQREDPVIQILATGGITVVEVMDHHGQDFVGVARCHANDIFCRREGYYQALRTLAPVKKTRVRGADLTITVSVNKPVTGQ